MPAKVIKYRFSDKICEELIATKWFEYELGDMYKNKLDFSSPENFIFEFNNIKHNLRKAKTNVFSPYEFMAQKYNGVSVKNLLITHHLTILVVNKINFKILHMYLVKLQVSIHLSMLLKKIVKHICY